MYVVPESEWVRGNFLPLAGAAINMDDVAARLGVSYEEYDEDGLGRARGQQLRMKKRRQIKVQHQLEAPPPYDRQITIYGLSGTRAQMMADMKDALAALGLEESQVTWTMDDVEYGDPALNAPGREDGGPSPAP